MKQRIRQMVGVALILFVGTIPLHGVPTEIECDNGECYTHISTDKNGWEMTVICDGETQTYSGAGPWRGTLCGVKVNGG